MRRCIAAITATVAAIIAFPSLARASELLQWTDAADVICVASVSSASDAHDRPVRMGQLPFVTVLITLQVHAVLKGDVPGKELTLVAYRLDEDTLKRQHPQGYAVTGAMPFSPERLQRGRHHLLFLKRHTDAKSFGLVEVFPRGMPVGLSPAGMFASTMPVGPPPAEIRRDAPPLLNVVSALLASLGSAEREVQVTALGWLGVLGVLLWDTPPNRYSEVGALIAKFGDRRSRVFLKVRVIPQVLGLLDSDAPQLRVAAVSAAAALQQVEVIPELVALARTDGPDAALAASALAAYRTHAAVPFIAPLVRDPSVEMRRSVVEALRHIGDQRSLPYLVDALGDGERAIRYDAVFTLATVTGAMPAPSIPVFDEKEKEYVRSWKEWAAQHREKLDRTRQELESAAIPR